MPQPTEKLATLRPDLAGSLEEFNLAMDRLGFIGTRVLPVLEVATQSGKFGRIPLEALLEMPETVRASGAAYNRGDWKFEDDSFATQEHGWEEPVDDREAQMYANYFDAELVSAARAQDIILRAQEKRVADLVFNATTFASQTDAVTHEWDNHNSATPVDDIEDAKGSVWNRSGLWPNALFINRLVFNHLRRCAQVEDKIRSSGAGDPTKARDVTAGMLAQVFDLDYVLIAGSPMNTANKAKSRSLAPIWSSEYAMVARIPVSNDVREPGLGRTFHWSADGSEAGGLVESYRSNERRSDIIRVRHDVQEKLLYKEAAFLLSNITGYTPNGD